MSGKLQENKVYIFSSEIHGSCIGMRATETAWAYNYPEKIVDISIWTKTVESLSKARESQAIRGEEGVCTLHRKDENGLLKWGSVKKYLWSRFEFIEWKDGVHLISSKEQKENCKLSRINLKKLSRKASDKSCLNRFSLDERNDAVLNIDMLFENVVMRKTGQDMNKCHDILKIERFEGLFVYEGDPFLFVYIKHAAIMFCVSRKSFSRYVLCHFRGSCTFQSLIGFESLFRRVLI